MMSITTNVIDNVDPTVGEIPEVWSNSIPAYSSRPGAAATIFLDFDGNFEIGPVLGKKFRNVTTPAFDLDGQATSISEVERRAITSIWTTVADDYSPFNVNVTTVDPGNFSHTSKNLRVAIGGTDFSSTKNVLGTADGNAFTLKDVPNIVFVFPFHAATGALRAVPFVADAVSHEAGHAFGLRHQSRWIDGERVEERHSGDGNRVPLMGEHSKSMGVRPTVWWEGINDQGARQGDMEVLTRTANGFGYRPDDHAGQFSAASSMSLGTAEYITGRDENLDPIFDRIGVLVGTGVIEQNGDIDSFRFETGGGQVQVRLAGPKRYIHEEHPDLSKRPNMTETGNLTANVSLVHANGTVIEKRTNVTLSDFTVFDRYLAPGAYYLKVSGAAKYGNVGQYTLTVAENAGAQVIDTKIVDIGSDQYAVLLTFNEAINPLSLSRNDVQVNGQAPGVGVLDAVALDSRRVRLTVRTLSRVVSVKTGPNIADQFGNLMDQNQNGLKGESHDYALATYLVGGWGHLDDVAVTPIFATDWTLVGA